MPQPAQSVLDRLLRGIGGAVLSSGVAPMQVTAPSGVTALYARASGADDSLPYATLNELIRALPSNAVGDAAAVDAAAVDAAAVDAAAVGSTAIAAGTGPYRAGRVIADLLISHARRAPILATVDDSHLLDPASAAAIAVAVRATAAHPVAWILTTGDIGSPPLGTLDAIRPAPGTPEPRPLDDLPAATVRALLVLAVSVSRHADEVTGALAALDLHVGDLAPAAAAGLITPTSTGWAFQHPDIADRISESATPVARRTVHAALTTSVRELRMAEEGELLAWHLAGAAAASDATAAEALGRAADGQRLRGALSSACSTYFRAANLSPDSASHTKWLVKAADAARLVGDLSAVGRAVREARLLTNDPLLHNRLDRLAARTSALRTVQPDLRALLEPGSAETACDLIRQGRSQEAEAVLAPAITGALLADPVDLGPLALPALATAALWTGDHGSASEILDRSIAHLRAVGADEHLAALLIVRAETGFRLGQWPTARDDAELAANLAARLGQKPLHVLADALTLRLNALMDAETRPDAVVREAETLGSEAYALWSRHAAGITHAANGHWIEAAALLSRVADGLERLGIREPSILPVAGDLVEAALRIGDPAGAHKTADAAHALAAASASMVSRAVAERCLGQVGDPHAARQHFEEALRLHAETVDRYEEGRTLLAYGRLEPDGQRARLLLEQAADRFAALGAWAWLRQVEDELSDAAPDVPPLGMPAT